MTDASIAAKQWRQVLLAGALAFALLLPTVSAGATSEPLTSTGTASEPVAELSEGEASVAATTGRYLSSTMPDASEMKKISQRCKRVSCYVFAIQNGESVLDTLVRLAVADRAEIPGIESLLRDLIAQPDEFLSHTTGESKSVLVSDAQDALQAVRSESQNPGSGIAKRGLDPSQQTDPLFGLVAGSGQMPSTALPWTVLVDHPYRWHARTYMAIGFASPFYASLVGSVRVTYKMDLNGRETRFTQEFSTASNRGRFKITENISECRIDVSVGFDYDCRNHPRPTQYLSQWRVNLRQPQSGFMSVFDPSYRRKFFEFRHRVSYRWFDGSNTISPVMDIRTGQSPRFYCDADTVQVCSFR